ncbi:MAG: hypothetical protein KME30_12685 [Iphinoe sp. HA4291-MV1]|jgi:hypothetical protein|nr:hypothetical protein [Iphinoe sp. HA4291-MV1]
MKQHLGFVQHCVLFVTPLIASSALGTAPSQAATFAYSEGEFDFTNISQKPLGIGTDTDTKTIAIANGGMVDTLAYATATFIARPSPPEASNFSLSAALGEDKDYLGQAESKATVIGNFVVDANTPFSFNFTTDLNLQTSIDNPPAENARAAGDTYFALIDTDNNSILDFFNLTGNLNTLGDNDFIAFQKSDNVTLSAPVTTSNFGGNQESATASIQGSFQRSFANKTNLALVEVKRNKARVTAPEPSSSLALLSCFSVIGLATKARRKAMTLVSSLKEKYNC